MNILRENIKRTVEKIATQLEELDQLTGEKLPNLLRPPASEQVVTDLESRLGLRLPEDYRTFLLLYNGWEGFNGESALLSVQEMSEGPLFEHIRQLQQALRDAGLMGPGDGLVIEGSYGYRIAYFDRLGALQTGRQDVVFWATRELERYPNFLAYLEGYSKTLAELADQERAKMR